MLANNIKSTQKSVKFVSYTGRYPNLCGGFLVLNIEGVLYEFGYSTEDKPFWRSGGECHFDGVSQGEWIIDVDMLPEKLKPFASEIDEVFNENVPWALWRMSLRKDK